LKNRSFRARREASLSERGSSSIGSLKKERQAPRRTVVHAMRAKSVEDNTRNRRFQREFRSEDPKLSCPPVPTTGIITPPAT